MSLRSLGVLVSFFLSFGIESVDLKHCTKAWNPSPRIECLLTEAPTGGTWLAICGENIKAGEDPFRVCEGAAMW